MTREELAAIETVQLAKSAVAFERAIAIYFPGAAKEIAELGRRVLLEKGIRYWISPFGAAITCVTCGLTSHNPHDVAEHYCGACHRFHDDDSSPLAQPALHERPGDERDEGDGGKAAT